MSNGRKASQAPHYNLTPAQLDSDTLVRHLARNGILVCFFNDVRKHTHQPWYVAVQYLGTLGFFGSYDVLPGKQLTQPLARVWTAHAASLWKKELHDGNEAARASWVGEQEKGDAITAAEFAQIPDKACATDRFTRRLSDIDIAPGDPIRRAHACQLIFSALDHP